jgi:hypothetical protein
MLSSITPFGERGRGNRYAVTVAWLAAGAVVGGSTTGLALGAAGAASGAAVDLSTTSTAIAIAAITGAAAALEFAGRRPPTTRRQVDERWLDEYRGWVYGFGFGLQLGTGLVTIVSTSAVYAAFALSFLAALASGQLWAGVAVGVTFGAVRGLTALGAARAHDPTHLRALHRSIERNTATSRTLTAATLTVTAATALVSMAVHP